MLEHTPTPKELQALMGPAYTAWQALCTLIETQYEMETLWNKGGKAGRYEYKYRRGGKTLCALYPREDAFGFMVILGGKERDAFTQQSEAFAAETRRVYANTKTYHDGLWLMLDMRDESLLHDAERLLHIKRRPNRKPAKDA